MHSTTFRQTASLAAALWLSTFNPIFSEKTHAQAAVSRDMVFNLTGLGDANALFDGNPNTRFEPRHRAGFTANPAIIVLRMNPDAADCQLKKIRFEVAAGAAGTIQIFAGEPANWQQFSTLPQNFGNGTTALEWHPTPQKIQFLKFVFEKNSGELLPQNFPTGEFFLDLDGDCQFADPTADCAQPDACPHNNLPFEQRMGVNNFVGKTQQYFQTAPFAAVREYLPWDHIQGHLAGGNTSPDGEQQEFRFAPCFPGYDLDKHYQNLKDFGREVLGTFKESSPFQVNFNYDGGSNALTMNQMGMNYASVGQPYLDVMERKPGQPADGTQPNNPRFSTPENYADHARAIAQIQLRYGKEGNPAKALFKDPHRSNQATFDFLENWNEQDKWWQHAALPAPMRPDFEQRLAYFTPLEYMAMSRADHLATGENPSLPLVMAGITDFDADYVRGCFMAWWELTGSDPTATFPFRAINLHHYSVDEWRRGIAPELDRELAATNPNSGLVRILNFRKKWLPQQQVWVTEFGFSDHPQDATAALPHYPNADLEEVQAQWLVRNYLIFNRLGVDRAFTYQLTDDGSDQWHGYFNHTGVIDRTDAGGWLPEFRRKKSWFYLFTLRNRLEGFSFKNFEEKLAADGRPMWIYQFENQEIGQTARLVWLPTDTDPSFAKYILPVKIGGKIRQIEFADESIVGIETELADSDLDGKIEISKISERPIFLLENENDNLPTAPLACDCRTDLTKISGATAAKFLLDDAATLAQHPRCDYGSDAQNRWSGAAGEAIFNIGGGSENDELEVNSVFLHDPTDAAGGDLQLDFLAADGQIVRSIFYKLDEQAIFPHQFLGKNFVWKRFENLKIRAAKIRVSKSEGASVGEIIVCSKNQNSATPPPDDDPIDDPTDPQPPVTSDCDCEPQSLQLTENQIVYELKNGQTLPNFTQLGDACADSSPDKSPFRMFDEQDKLGKICTAGYFDVTAPASDFYDCSAATAADFPQHEWFPGWSGGAAQYPFSAVVHFVEPQVFNGIFIYDSFDKGKIQIEYRDGAADGWKTLPLPDGKSYLTDSWRRWVKIFQTNQPVFASDLRVTMRDAGARFSELALCLNPILKKDGGSVSAPVSENFELKNEPRVFPNPTGGWLNLQSNGLDFDRLILTDAAGRVVRSQVFSAADAVQKIDFQGFAGGFYFLILEKSGRRVWQTRVVKF